MLLYFLLSDWGEWQEPEGAGEDDSSAQEGRGEGAGREHGTEESSGCCVS